MQIEVPVSIGQAWSQAFAAKQSVESAAAVKVEKAEALENASAELEQAEQDHVAKSQTANAAREAFTHLVSTFLTEGGRVDEPAPPEDVSTMAAKTAPPTPKKAG